MNSTDFAEGLRQKRKTFGLSQESLAKKLLVEQSSISKWERGTLEPSLDMLCKLSEILDISLDTLFQTSHYLKKDPKMNRVKTIFYGLNEEGQEALLQHAQMMMDSGMYSKKVEPREKQDVVNK